MGLFFELFCRLFDGLFERLFDRPFRLIDRFLGLAFFGLADLDFDLGFALDNSFANAFDGPIRGDRGDRGDSGNGSDCDFRTDFDLDWTLTDFERTFDLTLTVRVFGGDFEGEREQFCFRGDRPLFAGDFRGDFCGDFRGNFDGDLDFRVLF